jgi:hypothetical protein
MPEVWGDFRATILLVLEMWGDQILNPITGQKIHADRRLAVPGHCWKRARSAMAGHPTGSSAVPSQASPANSA